MQSHIVYICIAIDPDPYFIVKTIFPAEFARHYALFVLRHRYVCYRSLDCHFPALLHDMGQLMGEQLLPAAAPRLIRAPPEENILPRGKRRRLKRPVQLIRPGTGVHPHPSEVRSQRLLHRPPQGSGKRLTTSARPLQGLRDLCIDRAPRSAAQLLDAGLSRQPRFRVLARPRPRRGVVAGRLTHHLFRDAIRLLLIPIARRAKHQLGLHHRRARRAGRLAGVAHDLLHVAVAILLLQLHQCVTGAGKPAAAGPLQRRAQSRGTPHTALPQGNAKNRAITGSLGGLGFERRGPARRSEPGLDWGCCPTPPPGHPRPPP